MNVNEFDPLQSFLKKENEIKEAWEVVRIFESERQKFELQKAEYQARIDEMAAIAVQLQEKQRLMEEMTVRESLLRDEVLKVRKELNDLEHVRNAKKRNINHEYDEVESEVKNLSTSKSQVENELQDSQKKLKVLKLEIAKAEKILHERKKEKARMPAITEQKDVQYIKQVTPFPSHEKKVQIQMKDGKKLSGNPYKKLYSYGEVKKLHDALMDAQSGLEEVAKGCNVVIQEGGEGSKKVTEYEQKIQDLNQKILDLELENSKLSVEIRDLQNEDMLGNP